MTEQPTPRRVQRTRTAGQPGMPPGAKYVGRGTRWGNPARIAIARDRAVGGRRVGWSVRNPATHWYGRTHREQTAAHYEAVAHFETYLAQRPELIDAIRRELAGKDLACWCPPDLPCHADVLLQVVNAAPASPGPGGSHEDEHQAPRSQEEHHERTGT